MTALCDAGGAGTHFVLVLVVVVLKIKKRTRDLCPVPQTCYLLSLRRLSLCRLRETAAEFFFGIFFGVLRVFHFF